MTVGWPLKTEVLWIITRELGHNGVEARDLHESL
jgi:hypothetical protein